MERFSIRRKAQRVTRFVIVQFIALLGWVLVQLFFSISPIGRTVSFGIILVIEAIWWMGLLLIMLLLFRNEYDRFVQAALELEEANNRLRRRANAMLEHARDASMVNTEHLQNRHGGNGRILGGQMVMQEDSRGRAETEEIGETIRLNRENGWQRGARRQGEDTGGRETGKEG